MQIVVRFNARSFFFFNHYLVTQLGSDDQAQT